MPRAQASGDGPQVGPDTRQALTPAGGPAYRAGSLGTEKTMNRARSIAFGLALAALLLGCEEGTPGPMEIYDINPRRGTSAGEQAVQIIGANFRPDLGYMVYFGSERAQHVTILDGNTLLVATPAHDVGEVDVVIAADDGPAYRIVHGFAFDEGAGGTYEDLGETGSTGERF